MKLYYSPGACSLATHIALREAGMNFEMVKTDLRSKQAGGQDFLKVNPKGYVPALQLDNGQIMTEGVAILQWTADQTPSKSLLPNWGTPERYKAIEWLNFIATEVHKSFSPLWNPAASEETKTAARAVIAKRLQIVENNLQTNNFMLGAQYTVVDSYLFTIMTWAPKVNVDLTPFPKIMGFCERVKMRPAVQDALNAETTAQN